jgi:hypothetical protein
MRQRWGAYVQLVFRLGQFCESLEYIKSVRE